MSRLTFNQSMKNKNYNSRTLEQVMHTPICSATETTYNLEHYIFQSDNIMDDIYEISFISEFIKQVLKK